MQRVRAKALYSDLKERKFSDTLGEQGAKYGSNNKNVRYVKG